LLIPFLEKARNHEGVSLAKFLPERIDSIKYTFWPSLKESEPDLMLEIKKMDGQIILLGVEAKYYCGIENIATDEVDVEIADASTSQLERELRDLRHAHSALRIPKSKVDDRYFVLITAHRSMPQTLRDAGETIEVYWTNWYELHNLLISDSNSTQWEKALLNDLKLLLEKKGFVRFMGIAGREIIRVEIVQSTNIYIPKRIREIGLATVDLKEVTKINLKEMYQSSQMEDIKS